MTITYRFEIVLLLIAACVLLTVLARSLRLPQAGAYLPTVSCEATGSEHGRSRCNEGLRSRMKADSLAV